MGTSMCRVSHGELLDPAAEEDVDGLAGLEDAAPAAAVAAAVWRLNADVGDMAADAAMMPVPETPLPSVEAVPACSYCLRPVHAEDMIAVAAMMPVSETP